ncbi:MAG TPA: hypothetical protein VJ602_08650 [Paludibacter sp.]|nr:hypothetical protein [Paludibacter sp.]
MKRNKVLAICVIAVLSSISVAKATGSTQIWIPSTDIQAFKSVHLGIDNYIRTQKDANGIIGSGIYDIGLTTGISPFNKVQVEVGIDYLSMGDNAALDAKNYDLHPIYFNAKIGIPEDSFFKGSPAIAVGGYNFGTKINLTNYNIVYGLIAKTVPVIGRISAGYYSGNKTLLVDELGKSTNSGLLLSWDRAMPEISDKLWLAVDYQGLNNYLGAFNFGFSWAFSKNVSVIFAYDIYNNKNAFYNTNNVNANSFTTQLDINF